MAADPSRRGPAPRAILLAVSLLSLAAGPTLSAEIPSSRGQALFEGTALGVALVLADRRVPTRGVSCAGCHGRDAGGGVEAGAGPPIDWATLAAPTDRRPAYDDASFAAVLAAGVRPDGTALAGTMPRFAFDRPDDPAAIAAYLRTVAAEQRTGRTPDSLTLRAASPAPAGDAFLDAFATRVAELAPRGIYGRRLVVSRTSSPAFARLGALDPGAEPGVPDLFPLAALLGDESPASVRGAFATVAAQVSALAAATPGGATVVAPAAEAARLAALLAGRPGIRAVVADDADVGGGAVVALGAEALAGALAAPGEAAVSILADDMPAVPQPGRRCLVIADPRPAPEDDRASPLARYGRAGAELAVAALRACGPDCTRARMMRSFDNIAAKPAGWPVLDYGAEPLTGSATVTLWSLCGGALRPLLRP